MTHIVYVTIKGFYRDRVFIGIIFIAIFYLFIPSIATLSMRQVTELSLTLSLSLISFILLLLSVFIGGTILWKDIERRYVYSVIGLPISRYSYILGKFISTALLISLTSILLGILAIVVVKFTATMHPPERPVVWTYVILSIIFDALKYILLVAVTFLFSTISTSMFLPVFGSICTFFVGNALQEAYDYVHSAIGQSLPDLVKHSVAVLYFVVPNFKAFDLKVNAIYGVAPSGLGLFVTLLYGAVYSLIAISLAAIVFSNREMK